MRASLEIDLEDAIKGAKRRITFSDGRALDLTIPVGAYDGQVLRLKGQGSPGRAGAGDALIELSIRPHPVFRRENGALVMDLPVSVPDAVLGRQGAGPTPDGSVSLNVPAGSNSGSVLRLKGRGLPDGKGGRGDLLAPHPGHPARQPPRRGTAQAGGDLARRAALSAEAPLLTWLAARSGDVQRWSDMSAA